MSGITTSKQIEFFQVKNESTGIVVSIRRCPKTFNVYQHGLNGENCIASGMDSETSFEYMRDKLKSFTNARHFTLVSRPITAD